MEIEKLLEALKAEGLRVHRTGDTIRIMKNGYYDLSIKDWNGLSEIHQRYTLNTIIQKLS